MAENYWVIPLIYSKICVGCKWFPNGCLFLKEEGNWCLGKQVEVADKVFDEIIARLKKCWNGESVETRNQESTTLPRWVRRALGQDAQDMRKFNVKQKHIRRERRNG